MATLIPSLATCRRRMTSGERRLAERLEAKLEEDYILWYDVPIGASGFHPDFVVFHPRRGLLVLEVKDWRLDNIQRIDKARATIFTSSGTKQVFSPFEQARVYAHAITGLLGRDSALTTPQTQAHSGKLCFPWSYGVVFPNITRKQFSDTDLGEVMPAHRVICRDEMFEDVDAEALQQQLWGMFPWTFGKALSLPQIDRIRWHLFPEIRIGEQQQLFDTEDETNIPDLLRIMDLQQEQLARSLGEGHRIIHGVAGSGKTMILGYRCLHLARAMEQPILVLCYNVALATRLQVIIQEKGLQQQVQVRNFHAWCRDQLKTYNVTSPKAKGADFYDALVQTVIGAVDRGQIPAGQYGAVMIDEGHDFEPHWLKLVAQMVNPETNALLVLYDDAQSIYGSERRQKRFSFKSVGIQAQGRTTILRLNYRNTAEVLEVAYHFARDILNPEDADDDGIPLLLPESAERRGPRPTLIRLPSLAEEASYIAGQLSQLNAEGTPWRDMAVVYRSRFMGEAINRELGKQRIPVEWLQKDRKSRHYKSDEDSVKVVTIHSSKGLEFPVVVIPGIGYLPRADADLEEEARLMYVGMTRAMDRLVMTCHQESTFVARIREAVGA